MNIMLSSYDFNNSYCYNYLKEYLKPRMKTVILPLAHEIRYYTQERNFDELYHYEYGKDYKILCRSFHDYGIEKEDIYVLNPHRDLVKYMKYKIEKADVIFFCGGDPIEMMLYIKAMGLYNTLKDFKGIIMGASAGAMIQLDEFMTYPLPWEFYHQGFCKGLGYCKGFDVIVHWTNHMWQQKAKEFSEIYRGKKYPYIELKDGECIIIE